MKLNCQDNPVVKVLNDEYDAGIFYADPLPIFWAAEKVMENLGVDAAKAALADINKHRQRYGLMPAYVNYGHPLF